MPKTTVPIFADDDQEQLAELTQAVKVAERNAAANTGVSLRGGDASPDEEVETAKAAFDEFLDKASERAEGWVLQTIGHEAFRDLLKEHPPRMVTTEGEDGATKEESDPDDDMFGVNTETFPKALLMYVDKDDPKHRTILELKIDGADIATNTEAINRRVKMLSQGQFDALWTRALGLNRSGVTDPKLARFSAATPRSTET